MPKVNTTPVMYQEGRYTMAHIGVPRNRFLMFADQCMIHARKTGALFAFYSKNNEIFLTIGNDNYRWAPERKLVHVE